MLGDKGDSQDWLDEVTSQFPNGVPRFTSRDDCLAFMEKYNTNHGGSNPYNPRLMHIFTMLTSWKEVESLLLPNIIKARKEPSFAVDPMSRDYLSSNKSKKTTIQESNKKCNSNNSNENNVYESKEAQSVVDAINFRLDLPIHKCTTTVSTTNTLKYLFYHMKCGIFVMIRNGKLRIFSPFVNSEYRNVWGDIIQLEGDNTLGESTIMVVIYEYIFVARSVPPQFA
jgi:hypothetical protein